MLQLIQIKFNGVGHHEQESSITFKVFWVVLIQINFNIQWAPSLKVLVKRICTQILLLLSSFMVLHSAQHIRSLRFCYLASHTYDLWTLVIVSYLAYHSCENHMLGKFVGDHSITVQDDPDSRSSWSLTTVVLSRQQSKRGSLSFFFSPPPPT